MSRSIMIYGIVLLAAGACQAQVKLSGDTVVTFATADEGRKILTARDDFIRALSPFDRAARVKTDKDVSEKEFLEFVGRNVLDWTETEKASLVAALDHLKGSSEWRKIEAMDKAKNKRKYLRDLVDLSLHMNDGKAEGIAQAAMAVGAPGATISRNRLRTDASVDGIARELCDIIVGKTQVGNLEETVRTAGLFQDDAAGLIETSTVSLACTYLGGK